MATKKDLVEAYSFSRRRLVTAFVSGAPGGREVEPNRPGRAVVGGLALAVLLVAGGAVLGIIKSPTTADLDKAGTLVSEKETGADYLVLENGDGTGTELRPLANITSAMLVLGSELTSQRIPREDLNGEQIGEPIGILDAPATPPQPADLVQTGWSACTGADDPDGPTGIQVDVSRSVATTPTPGSSFVVRSASGILYLVAESTVGAGDRGQRAYAYAVPDDDATGAIVSAVAGASVDDAVEVSDQWVTLFPKGGELRLATFGIDRADLDQAWPDRAELDGGAEAQVGDQLQVGADRYVLVPDGALKLDAFSGALYDNLDIADLVQRTPFEADQFPLGVDISFPSGLPSASWPDQVRPRLASGELCAVLDTPGGLPGVVLATTSEGSRASSQDVAAGGVERAVDSGAGAFVQSGGWSGKGPTSPWLIDARGYAYPVGPDDESDRLGYGDVARVVVPQDWIGLFETGVALTVDAARCPPTSRSGGGCS